METQPGQIATGPANNSATLVRNLSRGAIALALKGEWERAAQLNRAILKLSGADVEAMNRLAKALIELGRYDEAKKVLAQAGAIAPYNTIAKKNLARLSCLESGAAAPKAPQAAAPPRLFIEESGKSGTTVLHKTGAARTIASLSPSDPANLAVEGNRLMVYTRDGEYLGQVEPKLGSRLVRLMAGGNEYEAAVIGVKAQGVAVIIRETRRPWSMHDVCSFPGKAKAEHLVYLGKTMARDMRDDYLDDDEERVIDEEALDTGWSDNE